MNNLLVLRERFKQIYVSHSLLVRKGAQFLLELPVTEETAISVSSRKEQPDGQN
jgi:hypothetical protein